MPYRSFTRLCWLGPVLLLVVSACESHPSSIPYVPWDGGLPPDAGGGGSVVLSVPPGATLCSTYAESQFWDEALDNMGSITLRPGHHVIPLEEGTYLSELIGEVLHGPERTLVEPSWDESLEVHAGHDAWYLTFSLEHRWNEETLVVEATTQSWMCPQPVNPGVTLTLEGDALANCIQAKTHREDPRDSQGFSTCEPPVEGRFLVTGDAAGGDHVVLDVRRVNTCVWSGHADCRTLYRAEVDIAGESRTVADSFLLAYSAGHHNCEQQFIVLLDPPMGEVAILLLLEPEQERFSCMPQEYPGEFIYMDAAREILRRDGIASWTVESPLDDGPAW